MKTESFLEYRQRVLDPVSPTFCAAKWLNATIWLWSGRTASCHHPFPHGLSLEDVLANPKALHNTDHKKMMRFLMQAGKRPSECEYCWKIEDLKRDNVSDRVFKSQIYPDSDVARIAQLDSNEDVVPKTLEIAFDRVCNFACSYCNSAYSTGWAREIQKNGPYLGLESGDRVHFATDGSALEKFPDSEKNPYIQAFWKWWPELSRELQEIRITGGEPLMSAEVWKFFDYFKENPESPMRFALNTNLGASQKLVDRVIENSHFVKNFDIYTSCEAVGAQAEYIRDGLEFDRYIANAEKLLREGNFRLMNFMMTINLLCLFSMTDLLDRVLELKSRYPKTIVTFSLNILSTPAFMSPLVLSPELKSERRDHLKKWIAEKDGSSMSDMERENVQRLIDYLSNVRKPKGSAEAAEVLAKDMKRFFEQYDKRRNKDIRSVFPPSFVRWYESL